MAIEASHHTDAADAQLALKAQTGDRSAFEELFRRHGHPAWRLALVVGGSADVARRAVADGFTLSLVRLQRHTTSLAVPFRLQVTRASGEIAASASRRDDTPADPAPNDISEAFLRLPERWRAALWLTLVEGGTAAQVAPILGLPADGTAALAARARDGLRARYTRSAPVGAFHLSHLENATTHLRALVVPMPPSVLEAARRRWQAWQDALDRDRRHGLATVVPLNPWVERVLATAAAGVLAIGVAAALTHDAKSTAKSPQLAAPANDDHPLRNYDSSFATISHVEPATSSATALARRSSVRGAAVTTEADVARDAAGGQSSSATAPSTTPSSESTPPDPAATSGGGPRATTGGSISGTNVSVAIGADGTGATVGGTTIGNAPPAAPGQGVQIVANPGNGLPPITIVVP